MARLVVHPGSPKAWEIELRPGINSLGRTRENDFQIPDPSVSAAHCQILVGNSEIVLRDLGSSNGSFVNGTPVDEKSLQGGESIRIGAVELLFIGNPAPRGAPVRLRASGSASGTSTTAAEVTETVLVPGPTPAECAELADTGAHACKFHPRIPARFFCATCQQYYCECCVASHRRQKTCRHCGAVCVPVMAHLEPELEAGFFERLPGAFIYPLRGAGLFVVVVGIVLIGMLRGGHALISIGTLRTMLFGAVLAIAAGGYLFTYLQCLLLSTVAGDRELPELPGIGNFIEDLLAPFLRLVALVLCCFGPALLAFMGLALAHQPSLMWIAWALTAFGFIYFPMALLAVGILDALPAANPLVVILSMFKAPVEYGVALLFLAATAAFRYFGALLLDKIFPESWITQSMSLLFATLAAMAFLSFMTLYLLVVSVHVLGLVYVCRKDDLGWLRN